MVADELKRYIRKTIAYGGTVERIQQTLLESGWHSVDILNAFLELGIITKGDVSANNAKRMAPSLRWKSWAIVSLVVVALATTTAYLWQDRLDLRDTNALETRDFYTRIAESQIAFTDTGTMVFPDERKFLTEKNRYLEEKVSFVEADLRTMTLSLYEGGVKKEAFAILSKGKEKSWWETPTGNYTVLGKSVNGYSSIGNVWMPYSIQFYGNYLVHGWPHYDDGTPVSKGYSGGCIRLSTEDAEKVFNFVETGTPVLVLEEHPERRFGTLSPRGVHPEIREVSAQAFLVYDLSSGETLLEKNADQKRAIASLTKLMTAVVAHEVIYLGRSIKTTPGMLAAAELFTPVLGQRYTGLDLLYPLLMQSSNASAKILASFVGEPVFIQNMNAKATSLQMLDTTFADASGISAGNVSTARDLAMLLQYIYFKRPFLFDIGRGVIVDQVGILRVGDTISLKDLKNVNEFSNYPDLVGVKNGKTTAAGETMTTVWNLSGSTGDVPVAIIVLGSTDRAKDTRLLHTWLIDNFSS